MADPSELIPRGSARIRAEIAEAPARYRLELARGQDVESGFVPFRGNVSIAKGKPPAQIPYYGPDALAYLTPDYLRNLVAPVYAKPGPDAVVVDDGDAVLLWDGSNAGESFRGRAGMAASTMARLAPSTIFDSAYFVHALKSLERILKSKTNGTGIPHVDREVLEALRLYCPSLGAQHAVARVLDNLVAAIHQTEAIIAKLKLVKQGLLHDLLTRGIDANGELRPPQSQAPHLYKPSPLGWIPQEWHFGGVASYLSGEDGIKPGPFGSSIKKDSYSQTGFKVYGQEQVIGGDQDAGSYFVQLQKFRELQDFAVEAGDSLISLVGTVGKVLVLRDPLVAGLINPRLMRLRPDKTVVLPQFLGTLLASDLFVRQIVANAGGGTMPVINKRIVSTIRVPVVPVGEQAEIVRRRDAMDRRIACESVELAKRQKQRSGLMDDLLTGRVRVTPMLEAAAAP